MTKFLNIIWVVLVLLPSTFWAQTNEKINLNNGVDRYGRGDYAGARQNFDNAYAANPNYTKALYNAGNAAYLSGNFDTAMIYYNDYVQKAQSPNEIAKAHYNIGNAQLQKGRTAESNPESAADAQAFYKEAINSYKQSLKANPGDAAAKYNLTYALNQLKKNQEEQQKQQDKQDKSDKNEENKDNKENQENKDDKGDKGEDGNKNGDNQDKKEGDQKGDEGDKSDEQKKEEQDNQGNGNEEKPANEKPVEGQISKAQALKDLDAINSDEGKILQKVYQKKGDKKATKSSDKDW